MDNMVGFSLIEVLMSLLLLSLIMLGLNLLGGRALQDTQQAWLLTNASNQLNNIKERLRVLGNAPGLEEQYAIWETQNKLVLPKGHGKISGHFPFYTLTISWGNLHYPGFLGCLTEKLLCDSENAVTS